MHLPTGEVAFVKQMTESVIITDYVDFSLCFSLSVTAFYGDSSLSGGAKAFYRHLFLHYLLSATAPHIFSSLQLKLRNYRVMVALASLTDSLIDDVHAAALKLLRHEYVVDDLLIIRSDCIEGVS